MDYRRDIDGLRTLAVVPVVIYHLRIPFDDGYFLPGGFLGVDIFFVLSGFLITKIILDEMNRTGSFSLANFYVRRARRILPLLFLMILGCVLAGIFLLTPSEMTRLTDSAMAALVFVSNGYWFFELRGYGAVTSLYQPLLHTWSLSVEEQFYLLFPLVLLLLSPSRWPVFATLMLGILLIASLVAAQWTTAWLPAFSFYSPISRAWEMLSGAGLAMALTQFPKWTTPAPILRAILPKLGVVVIVTSMVLIDLNNVAHPGLVTVPIVVATLALLWAAQGDELTTRVLSTAPFVFIGRLSYSIYLWHFPVFAFGRIRSVEQVGTADYVIWIALTMILSLLGYYLVERPFRYQLGHRAFMLSLSGGLIAVTCVFLLGSRTEALSAYRATQLAALYGGEFYDIGTRNGQTWVRLRELAQQTDGGIHPDARRPSDDESQRLWFQDSSALNIIVVGNSHSRDMFNALDIVAQRSPEIEVARFGMLTVFPDFQRQALLEAPNFAAADVIMFASRYNENDLEGPLEVFITQLQDLGKVVVLVGNTAEFTRPSRLPLFDYAALGGDLVEGLDGLNAYAFEAVEPRVAPLNARLRTLAQAHDVTYLSRRDLLCFEAEEVCMLRLPDGDRALYDGHHWTMAGAGFIADRIEATDWLAPVLAEVCDGRAILACEGR